MLLLFVTVVTVVQRPASRKWQTPRVKPENTWGFPLFPDIFGYYPHWKVDTTGSEARATRVRGQASLLHAARGRDAHHRESHGAAGGLALLARAALRTAS